MSIIYSQSTIERAQRSLRCSPFSLSFFVTMREESVTLKTLISSEGIERGYLRSSLTEIALENYLLWLIKVGVLRREVDGQGITDSFRLTPLGRLLIEPEQLSDDKIALPSVCDQVKNTIDQWFHLF